MSKVWIGIDNGVSGAVARVEESGLSGFWKMPLTHTGKKEEIDPFGLRKLVPEGSFVILEPAQMFSPGKFGLTSTHCSYGMIKCMLILYRIPFAEIHPKTWQKEYWTRPKMPKGKSFDTKAASKAAARKLWPRASFIPPGCRVVNHNCTDAALMAEYGRRKNL